MTATIGVDIGGTSVRAGVVDQYGTVVDTARLTPGTGVFGTILQTVSA